METTDHSNESLHQQASTQYLQGKFEEALATWRRILANDPTDERASEGIRLCELLTADTPSEAAPATRPGPTEPQPAVAEPEGTVLAAPAVEPVPIPAATDEPAGAATPPSGAAEAPIDDLEFELPNLDLDLPETEIPDPSRQSEGIDLGDAPHSLQVDGEIPEAPPEEPVVVGEALPETLPEAAAPVVEGIVDELPAPAGGAGAAELDTRVRDLLNEARAAHASGDAETARSVLTRVFILDETNAAALELQEQVEGAVPPTSESASVADLDAPNHDGTPGDFDLAAEAPEGAVDAAAPAPQAVPEPAVEEPPAEDPVFDDIPLDDMPEDDFGSEFDEPEDALEADAAEPSKGIKLPQLDMRSSKTRWTVTGIVAGVLIVAGVGFWFKLKSVSTIEPLDPAATATQPAPEPPANDPAPTETEPAPAEAEPAPVDAQPVEEVATLMARGNEAFDAADYAQAILAYNAVLEQEPGHFEATNKMEAATANYRAQQEIQQQWLAATSLFRDGEYRSALQMFYRLPQDTEEDRIRIERYQTNGWFNMGLLALRSGHCDNAREHFGEAAQIDPEDADVQMALALCDTCEGGTRRSGFQRAVASMDLRGLDD